MIGRKFAPLTIMSNEHTDIDLMITTFNTAVTETASEILGKHRQKKQPWVTAEILDLCNKRRELRKKRFEPERYEKYKEMNNIKRCMKKAKENWMGEQCSEIEENRRNNNSKRAYQLRISNPEHTRLQFDLEKLKDLNVLETFKTMTGGKFAPLTIMNNEDTDLDSMINTFNTAVTETASEILGKHPQKKKTLGHCRNS